MDMKKIIIIGAGFAGLSAAEVLACAPREDMEVTLVDAKAEFHFLPLLPDIIGRGIDPRFLTYPIEGFCRKRDFVFVSDRVVSIDLEKKAVFCATSKMVYDYLIIASGTETNFYGQENIKKASFRIDTVEDVLKIRDALAKNEHETFIIAGGGYTGIEIASGLRMYFSRQKKDKRIVIAEKFPSLLGPLPDWMKEYVSGNMKALNIEVLLESSVEKAEGSTVTLSGGRTFQRAALLWTAGVKTPDYVTGLKAEKTPQGRLKVDPFLRISENVFAAGDSANVIAGGRPLRMGVQFSIMEGRTAASNVLRHIRQQSLRKYSPSDLGYIVPMANNTSCGIVLGMKIKGLAGVFLHFFMCIFRTHTWKSRIGILSALFRKS
jgi:NADH:ubiquinone reductase (H+-translocating)